MPARTRPRLSAVRRERTGRKSDVRRLRSSGQIPGSIFGHGDPDTIALPERALQDFLRHHAAGAILDLDVDGAVTPALIREVDRDPLSGRVIHLGLQRVDLRETVRAVIPLMFTGEDVLVSSDLVPERQMSELEVHGWAELLPEAITVDVSGGQPGHPIRIRDLQLPQGIETSRDPDQVVVNITVPAVPADVAAALDAEEAAHAELEAGAKEERETEPEE